MKIIIESIDRTKRAKYHSEAPLTAKYVRVSKYDDSKETFVTYFRSARTADLNQPDEKYCVRVF